MTSRPNVSLKGRALKCLASREHSRLELKRKLGSHAESAEQLDALLDELEHRGLLCAERFAESLVHRKAARHGVARIAAELGLHRLPPEVAQAALQPLLDSEFERAHALWVRRYGQVADTPEERVRQHRFLTARGFGADVVRRVIRGDGLQFED